MFKLSNLTSLLCFHDLLSMYIYNNKIDNIIIIHSNVSYPDAPDTGTSVDRAPAKRVAMENMATDSQEYTCAISRARGEVNQSRAWGS